MKSSLFVVSFVSACLSVFLGEARAEQNSFYPAHVQVCAANLEESGQGTAFEAVVQYEESDLSQGRCKVVYYYGYEYGCEGFRGMCQIYPQSTRGLRCLVESNGPSRTVRVLDSQGRPLVDRCELTTGGQNP